MNKYRIVEERFPDGGVKFVLEQFNPIVEDWFSIFRHSDLEEVRKGRQNREARDAVVTKVIE